MERFLTKTQLHSLLTNRGHTFWAGKPAEVPTDVWPPPETIITVGLDPDGTLMPRYRERFFACARNADDEPLLLHAPEFALDTRFAAAEREPGDNYFARGPVRWLLRRIRPFEQVLLWPRGGFRGDDGLGFLYMRPGGERIDSTPRLARWFERHVSEPAQVGAALLSLVDLDDCQVLWEAANLVGESSYDFLLSDTETREVYLMHHHDKLVISIPDASARRRLLAELAGCGGLFKDCSGYCSQADEEYGW